MVTGYTVTLFTLLLLGCLIGIAAGFHMAYTVPIRMARRTGSLLGSSNAARVKSSNLSAPGKPAGSCTAKSIGRKENPFPSSAAMRPLRTIRIRL